MDKPRKTIGKSIKKSFTDFGRKCVILGERKTVFAVLSILMVMLTGCRSKRDFAYLQDAPRNESLAITGNFSSVIYPNDQLYIYVSSENPHATRIFNEETNRGTTVGQEGIHGYLVSQKGEITFPILGTLQAGGKTREEFRQEIERRLMEGAYVSDPVVTVKLMNFHVTVIGEVKVPQLLHSTGERMTMFEAIAQCGDISMDGLRDRVVVVRTEQNRQIVDTVDLTKKEFLSSPYYYLQQNDIVYVEPSAKKKRTAKRNDEWPQYVSIGVSAVQIAYRIINQIQLSNK